MSEDHVFVPEPTELAAQSAAITGSEPSAAAPSLLEAAIRALPWMIDAKAYNGLLSAVLAATSERDGLPKPDEMSRPVAAACATGAPLGVGA
jgi:hypothetical protein